MVKADLTRDYYADLEISSMASETEIKKQFRILALKYHPDRNPGREAEVNSKFQTIQSAVEVLTDPEQRAKYDTGRARAARGGGGGASAYSSGFASQARPASGFARGNPYANAGAGFPPPPRREARPKSQAPPPSAGANRYASNFGVPRPGSYVPKSSAAQDDAESRRKTYEAWNRMRGEQRQPEPTAYERSRPPPPPPPQPQSRPAPPPIPKRTGYAPNSMHDEPPAPETSAYSSQRHRAPTAKQETYAVPPPRKQAPADPFKTFREQSGTPLEPRLSTPYAGRGNGERTNPFESANLGRSNTTRQDSGSFGRSSRERHRSVSPSRPSYHPNVTPDFNESNRAGSETNINGSPKRTFSKTSKPSNLGNEARSTPIIDLTSSEEEEVAQRKYAKPKTRMGQDTSSTPSRQNTAPQAPFTTPNPAAQTTYGTPNGDPKIFSFRVEGQTYTAHSNPTRHSTIFTPQGTEKINTTFTPEDWQEKFEAGGYFGGTNPPTPSRQSSSSSGAKHANPLKARGSTSSNPYPIIDDANQPKTEETTQSPERGPKFTPDEWAETFKPNVFAAPQHPPAQARAYSRSGTTRRQKHAAASGKTSKPRTTAVESDDDSDPLFMGSRPVSKNGRNGGIQGSPMEMDIDPPQSTGGARNVNVEPSRPEWRTGQPSALNSAAQSPDIDQSQQAHPPPPAQPQFDGQTEQEGDLKTNFEDFKTTEPFMQTVQGLGSFADLKSDLPFQSKASSAVPFPKSFDSRELVLPPPPRGPKPPSTDTRPTSDVFDAYLNKMRAYIAEWIKFDARMVGHFAVRNEAVQMVSRQKVDWLGTLGDAHLDEYLENVREDERAREWWATAVEKHREKMEEFKWVKSVFRDGPQQARKPSKLFGEVTA